MSQETELLFKGSNVFSITNTICDGALNKSSSRDEDICAWSPKTGARRSTLLRDGIYALEAYISAKAGKPVRSCALLQVSNTVWSAEYYHQTTASTDIVVYNISNGVLEASVLTGATYNQMPKFGSNNGPSLASIFFALIPAFCEKSPEFAADLAVLEKWYPTSSSGTTWTDEAQHAMYRLCDFYYRGLKEDKIEISSMSMGDIPAIAKDRLKAHAYDGTVLVGSPMTLSANGSGSVTSAAVNTVGMMLKKYETVRNTNLAKLTIEQLKEVPSDIADDTVVPAFLIDAIDAVIETADSKEPVNALRFEGSTGVGKTFSVRLFAYLLGLAYTSINLNPDTDRMDLKDQIVPNTTGAGASAASGFVNGRPSLEDMIDDPISAYEMITGTEKLDVTNEEVQAAYDAAMEVSVKEKLNAPKEDKPQFVHVLSQLMRGVKGPYVVEIQEMSRARPGVLSGLNEVFDRDSVIHLESTGETFVRHPLSLIVSTDNIDYPGCKKISPDVRSRFSYIERLDALEKKDAVARVTQRLGFTDKKTLEKMWDIIGATATYCKDNNINSGDIGLREFMAWAQQIQKGKDRKKSFRTAVLNKATGNHEEAEEVMNATTVSKAAGKFFEQ